MSSDPERRRKPPSAAPPILAGLLLGCAWFAIALFFLREAGSANAIRGLADRIRIDLLECRRREKDFLLRSLMDPAFYSRGTTLYLEQHREALDRMKRSTKDLSSRLPAGWPIDVASLRERETAYDGAFRSLVEGYRRLGYRDSGLEGEWHAGFRELERVLQTTGNALLQRDLLRVRGDEKEFLLRNDEVSLQALHRSTDRLRESIQREAPDPASGLPGMLDRYLKTLAAYYEVEQEVGLNENLGLQGRFRTAAHDIEPIVSQVVERATEKHAAAMRRLRLGIGAASVLLTALLSTTFFLTRSARVRSRDLGETAAELTRSNGELQQFAYVASHDLQEPLRAVAGCVQLLQQRAQGKLDEKCDELIRHAVEGSVRMQTLIEDLLTLSRVGTQARPLVPGDAGRILQAALDNLAVAIKETGATVTHDALPTVPMDPTQILQVFQNLIGNSLKFRGPQAPIIHIGAEREGDRWKFSVRDNGIGIEPQYFEKIFLVFQRLHTRREYPGSGIGLAVCRKILNRHGGEIWLQSELNRGTTFYFTLPAEGKDA